MHKAKISVSELQSKNSLSTFLFVAIPFWGTMLFAQIPETLWTKTYGGSGFDYGYSVQQTTDGGYIITGNTTSFSDSCEIYLIKTDSLGDTLWTKVFDYKWWHAGSSVQQTLDGGFIVIGTSSVQGSNEDIYVIKTNANGDTVWTKTYGGTSIDYGSAVQQTSDGGYIFVGHTYSFGAGSRDVYLIKTDDHGDTLWTRTFGNIYNDAGHDVCQTTDGGYIVAGYTSSDNTGNWDIYVIKTDMNGDTLWTKSYGGDSSDMSYSIEQTTDGGYITGGYTGVFGTGLTDAYLIKTDDHGDTLWTKTYGGEYGDVCYSAKQTEGDGYIITGHTKSFGGGTPNYSNVYVVRTDENGDIFWTNTYGGDSTDVSYSVQQTVDGGFILAGYTRSFGAGGADVYLVRIQFEDTTAPSVPSLISPSNNEYISQDPISFMWHPATDTGFGVKDYTIQIALNSAFTDPFEATTQDTTYTTSISDTTYFWRVCATDHVNNTSEWSSVWTFTLDTQSPNTPVLVQPLDGIYVSDTIVDFEWSEVTFSQIFPFKARITTGTTRAAPVRYIFELDTLDTFASPITIDTLDITTAVLNCAETFYYWRIKAFDLAGNESQYSDVHTFGVDITAPLIESTTVWLDTSYAGPFTVHTKVTDINGVDTVVLHYKRIEDPSWMATTMIPDTDDWYCADISQAYVLDDTIKYYIEAMDIAEPTNRSTDPQGAPADYFSFIANSTGIEENNIQIPQAYYLGTNNPNPFRKTTTIQYAIPVQTSVSCKVYNAVGQCVKTLFNGIHGPGYYTVQWNAHDDTGRKLPAGIYLYVLESSDFKKIHKMVVLD